MEDDQSMQQTVLLFTQIQNCSVITPKCQILKKIIASVILFISKLNRKFSLL